MAEVEGMMMGTPAREGRRAEGINTSAGERKMEMSEGWVLASLDDRSELLWQNKRVKCGRRKYPV